MNIYFGVGATWWIIAGCSSLPLARSLLEEADITKTRKKSGNKYEDVNVIGTEEL